MKRMLFIYVDIKGRIRKRTKRIPPGMSDCDAYEKVTPGFIGTMQDKGYMLSNWHVIEV